MKKYGIFLGYAPEQSITNQGLGRLLAFVISGAIEQKISITLAYPKWYEKEIIELCDDHNIDKNKLGIITTNNIPIVLKIRDLFKKKKKIRDNYSFKSKIKTLFYHNFLLWISISNPIIFFIYSFLMIIIGSFSLPIFFLYFVYRFFKKISFFLLQKLKIKNFKGMINDSLKSFKNNLFAHEVYDSIKKKEFERLINKINKNKDIEAWLIPTIFWPEINLIKAKKVVVVPDIILYDFPILFGTPLFERVNNNLHRVIACSDQFITYSNYVKETQLLKNFNILPEKISVIHHGLIDSSKYLEKEDALSIIEKYQKKYQKNHKYLATFDFANINYIFYSSQIRPHKNFMNLLKAYKILLREKFINVKLIVTADLYANEETNHFIIMNRLQNDIIQLYNVPSNVLAALNANAICSVNPTLFEGGFPFTFLEAYTVGTPSIMGDIPMTTELIEDDDLKKVMLFNPFSVNDIVDKIGWGIKNKDLLFDMQKNLYNFMKKRTWKNVASDYIKVLEDATK